MPSIRDLVAVIRQRDGVDAAIVLGPDGLPIDGELSPEFDADDMSARIPGIIAPANDFGQATGRGDLLTTVVEYSHGLAIVSVLTAEAILLVLLAPHANVGQLLYELRRNREHFAALI